ncbi:polar growth protein [Dinochytrium kinnereticum]|nr:polar growth protein [Dinochytrium kinnereticum]
MDDCALLQFTFGAALKFPGGSGGCCKDAKVQCNTQRFIIGLDLSGQGLQGEIPVTLGSFSNLIRLDLSNNRFFGSLNPRIISDMTRLEFLNLSGNMLSGGLPLSLALLKSVSHLNLTDNDLSGKLPGLGANTELEYLGLGSNEFSGSISPEIFLLNKLESFNLKGNKLIGNATWVKKLKKLEAGHLDGNCLSGLAPSVNGSLIFEPQTSDCPGFQALTILTTSAITTTIPTMSTASTPSSSSSSSFSNSTIKIILLSTIAVLLVFTVALLAILIHRFHKRRRRVQQSIGCGRKALLGDLEMYGERRSAGSTTIGLNQSNDPATIRFVDEEAAGVQEFDSHLKPPINGRNNQFNPSSLPAVFSFLRRDVKKKEKPGTASTRTAVLWDDTVGSIRGQAVAPLPRGVTRTSERSGKTRSMSWNIMLNNAYAKAAAQSIIVKSPIDQENPAMASNSEVGGASPSSLASIGTLEPSRTREHQRNRKHHHTSKSLDRMIQRNDPKPASRVDSLLLAGPSLRDLLVLSESLERRLNIDHRAMIGFSDDVRSRSTEKVRLPPVWPGVDEPAIVEDTSGDSGVKENGTAPGYAQGQGEMLEVFLSHSAMSAMPYATPTVWTSHEVVHWLKAKGFQKDVLKAFRDSEIDGTSLFEITTDSMKRHLGIESLMTRTAILAAIQDLRQNQRDH